jgi:hypothetical protein
VTLQLLKGLCLAGIPCHQSNGSEAGWGGLHAGSVQRAPALLTSCVDATPNHQGALMWLVAVIFVHPE